MPAHTFLRSHLVLGAALLAIAPGCAVEHAQSESMLGASSGGGAAFFPATPPRPPAASAPIPAAPRAEAPAPIQAATSDARPGHDITVTASGLEAMELAVPPRHGTVALSGAGGTASSVRYTPAPGYLGADQFSLRLAGGHRTVTVSVTTASP